MRRLAIAATVAALTLIGGGASATTYVYQFTALNSDPSVGITVTGQFTAIFDYTQYTTQFGVGEVPLTLGAQPSGAIAARAFNCSATVDDGVTAATGCVAPTLFFNDTDSVNITDTIYFGTPDFTVNYTFAQGAFTTLTTPGHPHLTVSNPSDPSFFTGSLYVTEVPEPSIWALMITGVGLAGVALRTQRRRPVRIAA